jgi:hypothetical protein
MLIHISVLPVDVAPSRTENPRGWPRAAASLEPQVTEGTPMKRVNESSAESTSLGSMELWSSGTQACSLMSQ